MPHVRRLLALILMSAAAFALAACEEGGAPADQSPGPEVTAAPRPITPDEVTFMAGFKPQANLPFVGAYVAQEKGFFAAQNLEVEIRHVAAPGENFVFLASGEVQFTTADAATVLERRAGDPPLPLVAIALIGQRGQQGFAVLADSGIESPKGWEGKRAGYKGSEPTPDYLAILNAEGVDRSTIEEVRVGFEPQVLTEGQVDIFPVFLSNEPDILRGLGFETRLFEAADYGAPTLGLTYVTTEEYARENPDIVRRFLKAVLHGIEYARDNREEAVEIVLKFAPQEDPAHQRFMLDTELAAAESELTADNGLGWITGEQWQALHDFLVQYEALPAPLPDPTAAFNDEFLRQVYRDGALVWP